MDIIGVKRTGVALNAREVCVLSPTPGFVPRFLRDDSVALFRAAAILVMVFAQHVDDVVALTWNGVHVTDDVVTLQVGAIGIALPEPLDDPWRAFAVAPVHDRAASQTHSDWVFRGHSPGEHLDAGYLANRINRVFSARAARLGTLHELTTTAPVAMIAEALGYTPQTIERHAVDSAAQYAQYVASIR